MRTLVALVALSLAIAAQDRPNVLWISSEDNGPDLGCYGCPDAETPNLDALAARGVAYTRVWSNAPVCSTARTTIITGCYPQSFGAENHRSRAALPAPIRPFPQLLRDVGYWCTNNSKTDYNLARPGEIWDESSRQAHWRGRADGQPFFAVFNLTVSHESQVRKRPHVFVHDPASVQLPPQHPDTPEVRRDWAQYHDKLTEMDAQAGRILAELTADGLADDTIVCYWGDHGAGLPGFKRNPKHQGMHVPLIVHVPERWRAHAGPIGAAGSKDDRLVAFVDLGPTVLSLAGLETPSWMHGRAFLGPRAMPPKQYLLGYRGRMDERDDLVRTITDGRFVYVRNLLPWLPLGQHVWYMFETPTTVAWKQLFDAGKLDDVQAAFWRARPTEELYDLTADPHETNNLATTGGHRDVIAGLRAALRSTIVEFGDLDLAPEAGERPTDPQRTARWLDIAWNASERDPAHENTLTFDARSDDPVVRYWALLGLAHLPGSGAERASDLFERALEDTDPAVRIVAAEALIRHDAECAARARDVLVTLADRRTAGFFPALAAWNAIDRLDSMLAPSRAALAAIPTDVTDVPPHRRAYLLRVMERTFADLEQR